MRNWVYAMKLPHIKRGVKDRIIQEKFVILQSIIIINMNKIRVPKKISYLNLIVAPFSCILFLLYIGGAFWMFFTCLFAYFIQLCAGTFLTDNTSEISVSNEDELDGLDLQFKKFRIVAISLITLTILLDTFPFLASCEWFCYGLGLYIPEYEGGVLVTLMTVIIIVFWIFMIFMLFNDLKSPSNQYYNNLKIKENERRRLEKEEAKAQARHENNVSKYGDGYVEICSQFIFNEREKKLWLCQTEYSFDEVIDVEIEDITTQHTTGGDIITKTKTANMVGRAIVGGILTGGVGAIIGGATAKKESTVTPTEIRTIHIYNLLVTTNNISNPLITIPFFENASLVQKCMATLKAIIHNK